MHRDWLPHLRKVRDAARHSSATFIVKGTTGSDDFVLQCISAYFPPEINDSVDEVDDLCRAIQEGMRGRRTIRLFGGGINVELAEDYNDDPTTGKALKDNVTDRRLLHLPWQEDIKQNMRGWGIKVLNTFDSWWADADLSPADKGDTPTADDDGPTAGEEHRLSPTCDGPEDTCPDSIRQGRNHNDRGPPRRRDATDTAADSHLPHPTLRPALPGPHLRSNDHNG